MANLFEHKDRRVIPNWRSFNKTTLLGELNSFQNNLNFTLPDTNIDEYIIDWRLNKTVIHAADLLSAAIVNDKKNQDSVKDAANFILENKEKSTISQISLANAILEKPEDFDLGAKFIDITLDSLPSIIDTKIIVDKIKTAKQLIRNYPYNSILYVELSRYYSILGHKEQSIKAMRTALHFSSNNRFVLRCATRLFAHFHEETNDYLLYIHNILRNSPLTSIDPWLTSAEISIATIRKVPSKFIKKGMELVNSGNISPFNFTELASSIGTIELLNGSYKKSKDYFSKALLNPNDNSLAQLEWASTKDSRIEINQTKFNVEMNFEAQALDSSQNNDFSKALDYAAKWFMDMPFSKRPIMFGSNLASTILKDQKKAISFLETGLISHPNDPQIINNLAYSLSLENKPLEAFERLNQVKNEQDFDESTQVCLTATRGLAFMRNGQLDIGRALYIEAIEKTRQINNQELNWIAILNYAREEILLESEFVEPVMDAVAKIPSESKEIEIKILRKDVVDLHEKYKLNQLSK